jgi:hypothetical protein
MTVQYLPCATPGCNATPYMIAPRVALAIIEYQLKYYPEYVLKLSCDRCGRTTRYEYEEILGFLPPDKRPKALPFDHFWAYVLLEFKAWKVKNQRAFLADRMLVQRLFTEPNKNWYGTLKSTSLFAPGLPAGSTVKGWPWSQYELCIHVMQGTIPSPLPRPEHLSKANNCAIFIATAPDDGSLGELLCANVSCSNPSCGFLYGQMTYDVFKDIATPVREAAPVYNTGTRPIVTLECEACGSFRIIDERTFINLYRGDLSYFIRRHQHHRETF